MGCHLPLTLPDRAPLFVEFAHIYADSVWGNEQDESLTVMREYLASISQDNLVVSAVLIDDLHVNHATLDITDFLRAILRRGIAPDFVVFEGKLSSVADVIIANLPADRLEWQTFRKPAKRVLGFRAPDNTLIGLKNVYEDREEHTCALLSAAWSLCRAGILEFPSEAVIRLTEAPMMGERIVSVLHSKYTGVEHKVIELIRAAGWQDVIERLELVFFS